jgi:hypothetical protein
MKRGASGVAAGVDTHSFLRCSSFQPAQSQKYAITSIPQSTSRSRQRPDGMVLVRIRTAGSCRAGAWARGRTCRGPASPHLRHAARVPEVERQGHLYLHLAGGQGRREPACWAAGDESFNKVRSHACCKQSWQRYLPSRDLLRPSSPSIITHTSPARPLMAASLRPASLKQASTAHHLQPQQSRPPRPERRAPTQGNEQQIPFAPRNLSGVCLLAAWRRVPGAAR